MLQACAIRKPSAGAVLLQADMDVDADGSDSDGFPLARARLDFKPVTSYRWPKKSAIPSAYIVPAEKGSNFTKLSWRSKRAAERKRELRSAIASSG